tara:strand:+ start:97 stop:531 length:435 start_codon:yes stop_codon:yes gene_type:complete
LKLEDKMKNNETEQRLVEKNIRLTPMRILVLNVLMKSEVTMSLSDIERSFEKSDRVTIYRTLKTFEKKGLVHSIIDSAGTPKYAACEVGCTCHMERDLHVHFQCRGCDETFCLPTHKIPKISLPEKFIGEEVNLVVKGLCVKCA